MTKFPCPALSDERREKVKIIITLFPDKCPLINVRVDHARTGNKFPSHEQPFYLPFLPVFDLIYCCDNFFFRFHPLTPTKHLSDIIIIVVLWNEAQHFPRSFRPQMIFHPSFYLYLTVIYLFIWCHNKQKNVSCVTQFTYFGFASTTTASTRYELILQQPLMNVLNIIGSIV